MLVTSKPMRKFPEPNWLQPLNLRRKSYFLHENMCVGNVWRMGVVVKQVAIQRIQTLFRLAKEFIHKDPALAQRYVEVARKIAMAASVHLPKEYKLQVCRRCKSFILPGVNCRVRIKQRREPHLVITCLICGKQMRMPLRDKEEEVTS
jgi:ribonuclease P protein subunit RPR2